jgi:hypothetical protein
MQFDDTIFHSLAHQQRFVDVMRKIGKVSHDGTCDQEYGAALFVLTADPFTWEQSEPYVSRYGIDFEDLLSDSHWSGGYINLLRLAANLFNGTTPCSPIDLYRLDQSNFTLAMTAFQLRRHSFSIEG